MSFHQLKKYELWLHLGFWCLIFFFPYVKYFANVGGYQMSFGHEVNALIFNLIPTYFMYFIFFPLEKKVRFIPLVILLLVINALSFQFFDNFFHQDHNHQEVYGWKQSVSSVATYLTFSVVFFAFYSIKRLYLEQEKSNALQKEKQKAELSGLKAQVNPHFLFNTLNTIYSKALQTDEQTADMILKLSNNFRYLFDEGQNEKVLLEQEINHLKDYVNLQEQRLTDKVNVQWSIEVDNSSVLIAPLLLVPFVENAFKYTSILKGDGHEIILFIELKVNHLVFRAENPYREESIEELENEWKRSGIGIENTKSRLELIYPNNYLLEIQDNDNCFQVKLEIFL